MKLKKLLCLALSLCIVVSLMAACGGEGEKKDGEKETEPTEPLADPMFEADPADDDTLNILMIGNSFCYYYPDELWGMLDSVGIKARVCNVYASGCTMQQHRDWWKTNQAEYEVYATYDENGRQVEQWWTLDQCLKQYNWDIISLQEDSSCLFNTSAKDAFNNSQSYYQEFISYLKAAFPKSDMYWHQVWSFQVGYNRANFPDYTLNIQRDQYMRMQSFSALVCKEYALTNIPSGDAWQVVRDGGYDNLCDRLSGNDYYHEGDIGGGQYLNACVWFETLTGKSCIGNTWRPTDYQLDPALIPVLQEAAHEIVGATG